MKNCKIKVRASVFILGALTLASVTNRTFADAPEASPQPSTTFTSSAACEAARFVGEPTNNSNRLAYPCPNGPGYFVWGRSQTVSRDCQNTKPGVWVLYIPMKTIINRKIFSSSGNNAQGIFFCSAMPYMTTERTEFTFWDANTKLFRSNYYEDYYNPISANYPASWIAAYGIPKYWKDTSVGTTGNTMGMNYGPLILAGPRGGVEWQYDGP